MRTWIVMRAPGWLADSIWQIADGDDRLRAIEHGQYNIRSAKKEFFALLGNNK
jgi:hypothetical protein